MLLVGSEDVFGGAAVIRLIEGRYFRVVARSSALLEAMACLESGTIDVVLLSHKFRQEELNLFAFDARRRGFTGIILHTADVPQRAAEANSDESGSIQVGDFYLNVSSRRLWLRGIEVKCSPLEFELLMFLCKHPEELVSQSLLLEALWNNPATSTHTLRVLIRAVRAKIETTDSPRYIVTHRRFGYRFIPSPQEGP
ncbi:MAG: winged helix-turn-helix domain-containing protein [Terracidiphilus sp.]